MSDIALQRNVPDADRLSVLAAIITLAYTITRFIALPEQSISLQLPGVFFSIEINIQTLISGIVAGITAAGCDWLMRDHPALGRRNPAQHWLLPALTAIVIGIPISQLVYGIVWWFVLIIGIIIMLFVLVAEYIAVDEHDVRYPLAAALLSAVSFVLYLILITALKASGARLFLILPVLGISSWMVSLRVLHLRLQGQWAIYEAAVIAFIVCQLGSALHYWPLEAISYGLVTMGSTYALTTFIVGLIEAKPFKRVIIEPLVALALSLGLALIIG